MEFENMQVTYSQFAVTNVRLYSETLLEYLLGVPTCPLLTARDTSYPKLIFTIDDMIFDFYASYFFGYKRFLENHWFENSLH